MNTKIIKHTRYAKWQYFLIVITLLFLLLNALPNLYSDKVVIELTPKTMADNTSPLPLSASEKITPQYLNDLLSEHTASIAEIRSLEASTVIVLANTTKQKSIQTLLEKALGQSYLIDSNRLSGTPTWLANLGAEPIKLGLDLSGGVLFVLDVDTEQAFTERLKNITIEVKSLAIEHRIRGISPRLTANQEIVINLSKTNEAGNKVLLEKLAKTYPDLTQKKLATNQYQLLYTEQQQLKFRQETMKQTLKTMRGRIEELGITEAVTQQQGKNRIRIELPGVHNPEEAKRIIGATASLDFYQLAENAPSAGIIQMKTDDGRPLRLNSQVVFSGSHIKNARAGQDQMGMPLVNLSLDGIGGTKMSNFSKKNIGKPMVTVFSEYYRNANDEMVKKSHIINLATIQQHLGSQFSITNMSSPQAAQELSLLLRAGSLTAPVTIVQQRTIEATLGEDNIEHGMKALTIGIAFTLVFMAFWYRTLGVIANVALALNLVSLLGLMSLLPGAVLTLPGIAGLVLTVGMAVDTNVIIFERIKEELIRGRNITQAIEQGYNNAFSTILDANITTMLTGIILYSIGYGPVRGFALILCLGILTSIFTGVFVSKALTRLSINKNSTQLLGVNL